MDLKIYTAFIYIIFVTVLHKGLSIKCYECMDDKEHTIAGGNRDCMSGPFNDTLVNPGSCEECNVISGTVPYTNDYFVMRTCSPRKGFCDTYKDLMKQIGLQIDSTCRSCDSDYCNGGNILEMQTLAVLFLAAFLSHRLS